MISETSPSPSELLCETRTRGAPWDAMCKASLFDPIAIEEINYALGQYSAAPIGDVKLPPQDELLLLHYRYLGFERTLARHRQLRSGLGTTDVANGWGHQYSWSEQQLRDDWSAFEENAIDVPKRAGSKDLRYPFTPWWEPLRSRESKG
jgi:hypothetical protein